MTKARSVSTGAASKGDLVAGTGTNTSATLSVGTDGQVLTAASGQTTGLQWATPSSTKNISLITSGNINSGTSVTLSGLTADYIQIILKGVTWGTGNDVLQLQLNGVSGPYYYVSGVYRADSTTAGAGAGWYTNWSGAAGQISFQTDGSPNVQQSFSTATNQYVFNIYNMKSPGYTTYDGAARFSNGTNMYNGTISGMLKTASTITSIKISTSNTYTFNGTGGYEVYGA